MWNLVKAKSLQSRPLTTDKDGVIMVARIEKQDDILRNEFLKRIQDKTKAWQGKEKLKI